MAQIIKHRRGGIDAIASATAKKGELVMATGSVGQLNGPFIFIGETDGAAGGFRSVSKIYQGSTAPDLSNNNWGTTLNGTPFYSSDDDTLYILGNGGNTAIDLTGNIEGNIIDSVTINNLDGNLNLVGDLMITGDTYQTGSITLTGDVTLRGNINIGDNLTGDTVTLNGEISSSLLPADTNAFSLGASGQTWSDVWAENAHFTNISLNTISFDGLTEGRVALVGPSGSLVDSGSLNLQNGQLGISGSIKLNDSAYIYNDGPLFVEDNTNGVTIQSNNYAELQTSNAWVWVEGNNAYVEGGNYTKVSTDNGNVDIESYNGSINLNNDSNNNINMYGHTYIQNHNLYVDKIWDISDNSNYLELYGWNTNDGYWWEGGNGWDTTLLNNYGNSNLNIIKTSTGNVNIDATNGSVNIHSQNGMNVTGSLIVSDASGVFNSSLNVNNSNLTLNNGSNLEIQDNGTLTVNGTSTFQSNTYGDNYMGNTNNTNGLHLNGGNQGAPNVELVSTGQISLFSEGGGSNYAINMTGSVQMANDLAVSGSLFANNITNYTGGGVYIDSNNYSEISYNDEQTYIYVASDGIYGSSNSATQFYSNGGDTTIQANNGYNVNITGNRISLNGTASFDGNLYVSGNLEVLGSATEVHIQSQVVELDDNIIRLNAYSPFERYAGFEVMDSGSTGVSGSLLWDSLNDYWMFVSSSGQSSKMIGTTAGTYGSENSLTSNMIPKATGLSTIGDSLLGDNGTTLTYNTNKFTVDSASGDTYINGNVTLNSGGSDLGNKTSGIVFRNDDGVLGFVSTTETTDVLDGILGYKNSDGGLVFSTVIDGGTY